MTVGKKRLTTLKVDKETADLVRIYCIFNDIAVQDFVREVLEDRLEEFREWIDEMKRIELPQQQSTSRSENQLKTPFND